MPSNATGTSTGAAAAAAACRPAPPTSRGERCIDWVPLPTTNIASSTRSARAMLWDVLSGLGAPEAAGDSPLFVGAACPEAMSGALAGATAEAAGTLPAMTEGVAGPVDVVAPAGCVTAGTLVVPVPPVGFVLGVTGAEVTVIEDMSGLATSVENGGVASVGSWVPTPPGASLVWYGTIARLSSPGVVSAEPSTKNVTVEPSEDT